MKRIDFYSHDGQDILVAVRQTNTTSAVMTSIDGVNWTHQSTPNVPLFDVCYAAELGLMCAVGGNGAVITSTNGVNWTSRTAAAASNWNSICWSPQLNLFLATALSSANFMTSPDGINWTSRAHGKTSQNWRSCQWLPSAGLFAAGGPDSAFGTRDGIITSPDGITWTTRTTAFSQTGTQGFHTYRFSKNPDTPYFLACGRNDYGVMTSPDGITWTWQNDANTTGFGTTGVVWGPDAIALIKNDPTHLSKMFRSTTNGASWTQSSVANAGGEGLTYSPGLQLYVMTDGGPAGHKAMYSSDGSAWTAGNTPGSADTNGDWFAVCAAQASV